MAVVVIFASVYILGEEWQPIDPDYIEYLYRAEVFRTIPDMYISPVDYHKYKR